MEKKKPISQKLRGGYYTPDEIAKFICKWAIDVNTQCVLEPSCGDGNFIEAAIRRFNEVGINGQDLVGRIKGVELIEEESLKAKLRAKNLGLNSTTIVNSDFFHFAKNNESKRYDVVVGNPPFIRYQNFPEAHRVLATQMMQELNLNPNGLTNIWVPFLVISASILSENGKLGMVIPAELFQVKYAAETRVFLAQFFSRITIVTFKKLVFSDIQQEVVLLLCEKKPPLHSGIRVIECEDLTDLNTIDFETNTEIKTIDHSSEKWTKYFLEADEIELLRKLKTDKRVKSCRDYLDVDVGLVTGRNEFFMLSQEQVDKWKLHSYVTPIVGRSSHLKGIKFLNSDLELNIHQENEMYLFLPPNKDFSDLPKKCQDYIAFGQQSGFHTGYKCRIRKRWYITPSVWSPDAFALRQISDYPKLILNKTDCPSTDTVHRVKIKKGTNKKLLTVSFLNSLTFAFSEITGRSYGGGVMTFEPSEIEEIKIPELQLFEIDFNKIDRLIRERKIESVLNEIDSKLLIDTHRFSLDEVKMLRGIWKKLSNRRVFRSRLERKVDLILV